ncbi:hypothetical protein D3C87_1546550 [compost metagenome]
MSECVDRVFEPQRASVIGVARAGHRAIFRRFRLHVEIAHDDEIFGMRRLGKTEIGSAGHAAAFERIAEQPVLQKPDLGDALGGQHMIEMHGIDAQRPVRRGDQRFGGAALQVHRADGAGTGKRNQPRRQDRPARQDHVAKLEAPADGAPVFDRRADIDVARGMKGSEMTGEKRLETGDQIDVAVAVKTARHFLQRDDVGAGERRGNALGVKPAVKTDAVLDVVAGKTHDIL